MTRGVVGGEETPPHHVLSDEVDGGGNEGASLKLRNRGMVVSEEALCLVI